MRRRTTIHWRTAGTPRAIPALLAAGLVLSGCSATHVGDSWQCPVAQGTACTSVGDADPAVKTAEKAQGLAIPELPVTEVAGGSGATCAGNCAPLAWLAKWFGTPGEPDDGTAEPDSASPAGEVPTATDEGLRTKEKIARIWIAPFVDAAGVYREGQWVRTVLEPARWRLR